MSTVLGVLANIALGTAVYQAYLAGGKATARHGTAALIAIIFMTAGICLGIWSTTEKDRFRLFTVLGILANFLAFGMLSLILFAGAYVD